MQPQHYIVLTSTDISQWMDERIVQDQLDEDNGIIIKSTMETWKINIRGTSTNQQPKPTID